MGYNGLIISVEEFQKLPNNSKLNCLYENQGRQFDIMKLQKKMYSKIQINQRIQYGLITGIMAAVVFLFKHALDKI